MPGERTEKPTPKRRDQAKKEGQVARSNDMNGAVVMIASLMALGSFGPKLTANLEASMYHGLSLISTPDVVSEKGLGNLLATTFKSAGLAVLPIAAVCMIAGDDPWTRQMLAPLLRSGGYRVTFEETGTARDADVIILCDSQAEDALSAGAADTPVIRLTAYPDAADEDHVYRYDRNRLLDVLRVKSERRRRAR